LTDFRRVDAMPENEPLASEFLFLTLMTYRKRKVFFTEEVLQVLVSTLEYNARKGRVQVGGYVFMPDHIHLLVRPMEWTCDEFVKNFKSYTGIKIKSGVGFDGRVWRRGFFLVEVSGPEEFLRRVHRMHSNPVKARLARAKKEFRWSSWLALHGQPADVPITVPVDVAR
jgi:putative transposase